MSHASQQLMSDASADSKNVIRQTIADLHERLGTLDCHAKEKQEKLQQKEEQTQKYQVYLLHASIIKLFTITIVFCTIVLPCNQLYRYYL